jgi:hypothetical protein
MAAKIGSGGIRRLLLTGNLARRNPAVLDIARARFGVPCSLSPTDEEAACGAAFAAAQELGLASTAKPAARKRGNGR